MCNYELVAIECNNQYILEVENVRAGQGLQLLVPLSDRLPTHATVELQLFHTLQELHHLLPQLILLLLTAVDAFTQAVHLQDTQLEQKNRDSQILC